MTFKKKNDILYFNTAAWLKDLPLMSCTLQTQGAWIKLICHMHESEKYGYLIANGLPLDIKSIQNLLGVSNNEIFNSIWEELTNKGIIKKDSSGAYFSKRMVQDHKKYMNIIEQNDFFNDMHLNTVKSIINYLNIKTNKNFNFKDNETIKLITGKLNSGRKESDFKHVIDVKCEDWLNDSQWDKYLRPSTLFGPKFDNYLHQKSKPKPIINQKNPYNDMMI